MLVLDVSTWIDTETAATLYMWFGLIGLPATVFFGSPQRDGSRARPGPALAIRRQSPRMVRLTASS
jgi:hypothetical protein